MKQFKRSFIFTLLAAFCTFAVFISGYWTRGQQQTGSTNFPILHEAYEILIQHAFKPIPTPPAIEYGMIRGMLQAYGDPHTIFLEPVQSELETNSLQGSYGGIGVRLGNDAQGHVILYPFQASPAYKAGVKEGDRLLMVGDLEISTENPIDDINAAIRGPVGQKVTLKIARAPDYSPTQISVKFEVIQLPSVSWHIDTDEKRLGIVEINIIATTTPDEVTHAVQDLTSRGVEAIVLDLRNNGGGLLDAGIDTARLFLKDGVVIEQQYRGEDIKKYEVDKPGLFVSLPMTILVNQNTASASEIIAGSLQVHKRAKLIGTPTYGKDTVQLVFNLRDGSSLHVTAAQWWIPGLEPSLGGHGLQPDISLSPEDTNSDNAIRTAIQVLFPSN